MLIEGWYRSRNSAPPAPFVRAVVEVPKLGVWGTVDFLADTGADNTTLHPDDIAFLQADLTRLDPPNIRSRGIGGRLEYHTERANLYFGDGPGLTVWQCEEFRICAEIRDPQVAKIMEGVPSLLGRNFINLCLNVGDPKDNRFSLEPYRLEMRETIPRITEE